MKFKKLILICLFGFMSSAHADIKKITVCDDDTLWPPYVFLASGNKHKEYSADVAPIGYAIDSLKEILKTKTVLNKTKISYTLKLLPWEKCLKDTREGSIDMILESNKTPEFEVYYLFSKSFYQTHHAVFFSKKYHPNGFNFENISEFKVSPKGKHYRVCELNDYVDYTPFGIADADTIPVKNITTAVQKLQNRECDYFFGIVEVVNGYYKVMDKHKDISFEELSMIPPTEFFFAVSKKFANGKELIDILNLGIDNLDATGVKKTLENKWLK